MRLNLVMTSDIQHPLRFNKSNNSGTLDVPYSMENSSPLARYLETHIPNDWVIALQDLYIQERAIIEQRQALMVKFKALSTIIFPPLIKQFKHKHPEHFI